MPTTTHHAAADAAQTPERLGHTALFQAIQSEADRQASVFSTEQQ
jgi:hypothetical protein